MSGCTGHPGHRAAPVTLTSQCASLSSHEAGERARETWTLSPATKQRSGAARGYAVSDLRCWGRYTEACISLKGGCLSTVFEEYEKIASKSIEDSIKSETHGSLEEAMLTVGKRWGSVTRHTGDHSHRARQWGSAQGSNCKCLGTYFHLQGTTAGHPQATQYMYPSAQHTGIILAPVSSVCFIQPRTILGTAHIILVLCECVSVSMRHVRISEHVNVCAHLQDYVRPRACASLHQPHSENSGSTVKP